MSFIKRTLTVVLAAILLISINTIPVIADTPADEVTVVFTSDLHSNVSSYNNIVDGKQVNNVGGFARLKTFIDEKRNEKGEILLVDCGDSVMGTMSHALVDTEAFELSFLNEAGYDALVMGNHDFDFGAKALSDMYSVAKDKFGEVTPLVICNIEWTKNDDYTKTLSEGADKYGHSDYTIVEKNGNKIAVLGVLGIDAIKCAPTCELSFIDPVTAVKETVAKIKEKENPDMIVCLSHSGTGNELGETEDETLAKEVPDIDVIVSGHTHTLLNDEIKVGNTHIISCGAYSLYTGDITLKKNSEGRWDSVSYEAKMMDSSVKEDETVLSEIEDLKHIIDEKVLSEYNLKSDDIIAVNNDVTFEEAQVTYDEHTEMKLGNILSDSYRYVANTTPTAKDRPFDASVVPSGTIRDTITKGNITVADAFKCLSLGTGKDGNIGYPLVSVYLTGKEIRTIAEVDASISDLMTAARLYYSGVSTEFNPKRMILNKTVDVWRTPAICEDSYEELDNDKLYRIVTDSYSMSMLGAVTDLSKGILSVVPKDENGNPIEDPYDCIIYDENGNELKAWVAFVEYLQSFESNEEGISEIPAYYNEYHNRKVVNDSFTLRAMFKNTSKYFYIILAICLLIILLILFIVRVIVKKIHKKKVFKN